MYHILRDIFFIITSLALYYVFLQKGFIHLWQISIIFGVFVVYVIVYILHSGWDKDAKAKARDLARTIKEEDTRRLLE